jgi:ESCRT-I complex subunit TSG101
VLQIQNVPPLPQHSLPPTASSATSAPTPNLLDADDSTAFAPPPGPQLSGAAPPPPRPPNPELLALHSALHAKLHASLTTLSQTLASDTQRLQAAQRDLLAGEPAIRDEMARLEAVRDVCRAVGTRTKGVVTEAESRLGEVRRKGEVEVDELVCSTTIVYDQSAFPTYMFTRRYSS